MIKSAQISGFFMVCFLATAAILALSSIWQVREKAEPPELAKVITGQWTAAYEKLFNKGMKTYDPSVTNWGAVNYFLFSEGKKGVLIGKDGWLYTDEEFQYNPDREKQLAEKLDYIATVRDRLKKNNIELVVAPLPSKARIYPEYLGRYKFPSYNEDIYEYFVASLNQKNIATADLLTSLQNGKGKNPVFLKTDTHWTPEGAKAAAEAIALTVSQKFPGLKYDTESFRTLTKDTTVREGDLLRYVPLGVFKEKGPQPDSLTIAETQKAENTGEPAEQALFEKQNLPITLVGTSYSANPAWNFEGFLKETLRTDVLNAADEGLGPFETMDKYLEDESFKETPPLLVIWEIPERYLTLPDKSYKHTDKI